MMSEPFTTPPGDAPRRLSGPPRARPCLGLLIGLPALAVALGAGVFVGEALPGKQALAMLTPAPIATMKEWNVVAVKGQVAEVFGNKFVIQDPSGRALVETGPQGEGGALVAPSESVTVQGRFEHGFLHAAAISHADGRNDVLGPPGPPPPWLLSWGGFHGLAQRLSALAHG